MTSFDWSPDGRWLAVTSASLAATVEGERRLRGGAARTRAGEPPASDLRYIDRLQYQVNGKGFVHEQVEHLWLVDAGTGEATRLTGGQPREAAGLVARRLADRLRHRAAPRPGHHPPVAHRSRGRGKPGRDPAGPGR